jgi:hypothetical protein
MLKTFAKFSLTTAAMALVACGPGPVGPDGGSGGGGGGGNGTNGTVNGKPAADYYAQFNYETLKTYSSGAAAFATQSNGDDLFLISVYLFQNGTYTVYYGEGQGTVTSTGHSANIRTASQRKVTGTWSIDGVKLKVGDLLSCDGITVDGKETMYCSLTRAVGTSAAVGKSATLRRGFSATSPDDSTWKDYTN